MATEILDLISGHEPSLPQPIAGLEPMLSSGVSVGDRNGRSCLVVSVEVDLTAVDIEREYEERGAYDILTFAACDTLNDLFDWDSSHEGWYLNCSFDYDQPLVLGRHIRNVTVLNTPEFG